jgi:hypothetical protein
MAVPVDVQSDLYLAIQYAKWHWDQPFCFPEDVFMCAEKQRRRIVGGEEDGDYVEIV